MEPPSETLPLTIERSPRANKNIIRELDPASGMVLMKISG
jgi:hypothetical protein